MSANFGVLVGLTMTWFSEEMLASNICIRGFMCSAIKKSWKVSSTYVLQMVLYNKAKPILEFQGLSWQLGSNMLMPF